MLRTELKLLENTPISHDAPQSPENGQNLSAFFSSINIKEEIKSLQSQINTNVKYDIRINGMRRMIVLINNGILQNQEFLISLPFFHSGLVSSISNSRNSSTKTACTLISLLASKLRENFDSLGNFMRPFASQYAIRTQIIAECCLNSMITIAKCCCTKKILVQLAGLCTSKVPKIRYSASKCLYQFITSSSVEILEDGWYIMSKSIRSLLNDPNIEIKANTQKAAKQLLLIDPNHYQEILSYLSSHSPKLISKEKLNSHDSNNDSIYKNNFNSNKSKDSGKNYNILRISDIDDKNAKHQNNYDEIHTITKNNADHINIIHSDNDNFNNFDNNDYNVTINKSNNQDNSTNQNYQEKNEHNYNLNENQIDDDNSSINTKKGIIYINDSKYFVIGSYSSSSSSENSDDYISESERSKPEENLNSKEISLKTSRNQSIVKYSTLGSISVVENYQKTVGKKTRNPAASPVSRKSSSDTEMFSPIQKISSRCASVSDIRLRTTPLVSPSIRQANGHGKSFLDNLKEMIEQNDTSEISDIISSILDDVIKCCSLQVLSVSAISVLRLLLTRFHNAFECKLTQIIPILLNHGAKSSQRASDNAMQLLKELSYYFPPSLLVKATVYSPPSPRLASYCSFLVCQSNELFNDATACQYLLNITLDSYIFDMKSSGRILDVINEMRPDYIKKFFDTMDDKQFYSYQKHFKDSHPNVDFPPPRPVNVPEFPDINSIQDKDESDDQISSIILNWTKTFITFVENLHSFQWKIAHSKIFKEINKVMLYKNKCPESIFNLALYLLQKRGFDDINIILSGIFKNLRSEINSKKAQKILLQYFKYCDTLTVFTEFTIIITNGDLEISLNAIDFSILLLKSLEKEILIPILPEFTLKLSKLLSNEKPEIRKGAVLCFVSIFANLGQKEMEQYTNCLTQAQLKLILIYLEINNHQKQLKEQIEDDSSQSEKV